MEKYNSKKIESKWQDKWEEQGIYKAEDRTKKPKKYILLEFPYPSGAGLHVGHCRSYSALDTFARKKRMDGDNVLFPMGWDAFGLPTENFAIKNKIHPQEATRQNIANFKKQIKSLGLSFDWSREINTTDPKYYKWTQWIFLKLFEKGLAYQAEMPINWCPSCKIGLANEEVVNGKCERCGAATEKQIKKQWMLKITDYADRLIKDLEKVDYPERVKTQQINWIGKSEGAEVEFKITNEGDIHSRWLHSGDSPVEPFAQENNHNLAPQPFGTMEPSVIKVFTTRPDTLFGCTYIVVCPEHEIIRNYELGIKNYEEVEKYIKKSGKKSDLDRTDLAKEKTGVELKGIKAINPVNNKEIPIFVADYVLPHYGTGAIMAVPAHDERDFEFAKKYNLEIKQVIQVVDSRQGISNNLLAKKDKQQEQLILKFIDLADKNKKRLIVSGGWGVDIYIGSRVRYHEDIDICVDYNEAGWWKEKLENLEFAQKIIDPKKDKRYHLNMEKKKDGLRVDVIGIGADKKGIIYDMEWGKPDSWKVDEKSGIIRKKLNEKSVFVFSPAVQKFLKFSERDKDIIDLTALGFRTNAENGININSGFLDGLETEKAKEKIIKWLEEKGVGKKAVNYKLRDWVFSRQHYWGEPIPLVHCKKCGIVPISEKDLPVELPFVKKYEPTKTGESPLANISKWVNVKCPKCGGSAKRETDTMPNWAGSSWYYLAYIMRGDSKFKIQNSKLFDYWMPVDFYNGGMEHTTLHLLYSRFWHKFLFDIGVVSEDEPYKKRTSHGMVLAEDGRKMSKSLGNVINPDDVVKKFGADSLRLYEMFMGPFEQAVNWSEQGVVGMRRFLEKAWKLQYKLKVPARIATRASEFSCYCITTGVARLRSVAGGQNSKLDKLLHQTIKKVTEDIDNFKFNTAISQLMILANEFEKIERWLHSGDSPVEPPCEIRTSAPQPFGTMEPSVNQYLIFLKLLSPFAPHFSEEVWHQLGNKNSIFKEPWPKYDLNLIKEEKINLIIQINGKVRDKIEVDANISEEKAKEVVIIQEKVKKYIKNKKIKKIIFVPGKLINIVI